MTEIDHRKLWATRWEALCRLGRSLGLRVRSGPEGHRRGPLVDAIKKRMVELELSDAAARKKYDRRRYPIDPPGAGGT